MIMLSVISSSSSRSSGTAQRWQQAPRCRSGSSRSSSVRAERLTATPSSSPAPRHAPHWRSACVEHVVGQRDDQAGLLGERDELVGRQRSRARVLQRSQRLGADERPVRRSTFGW